MNRAARMFLTVWMLVLAPGPVGAAPTDRPKVPPAAESASATFEFGVRPAQPVFDLTNTLPPATAAEITRELDAVRKSEGIDVIVVVVKSLDGAPPEHVAKRFADAWCSPLFHCVVLHVPGDKKGPWIVPGGKLLRRFSPDAVSRQVAAACHRAALEPQTDQKVRAAATEASDMLRIWVGDGSFWALQQQAKLVELREDFNNHERLKKLLVPAIAVGLVILLGATFLAYLWLERNRARRFPEPGWQRRLGAPYAGGNDATLRLSRQSATPASPAKSP